MGYIDSSCAVDRINYSLVTPVNRQTQGDGYEWRIFVLDLIRKMAGGWYIGRWFD